MTASPTKIDFNFSIAGKVAVVTGAASGIGAAIVDAFASKGAHVVLLDVNLEAAHKKAQTLSNAVAISCDVTKPDSIDAAVAGAIAAMGRIDILVNSAGIVDLAPCEDLTLASWQRTLDINLTGSFLMAQAVGRHMIAQKSGKIINMASQAGSVAINQHVAYCASKFAIIGMSKTMALEWGQHGITVNTISPTVVLTELGRKAWAGPVGEAFKKEIPTGRFAEPEEIAAAAVFLASQATNMINGADLLIDGGFTVK
jgi:D-threitol dehydrogenase (NAD+)